MSTLAVPQATGAPPRPRAGLRSLLEPWLRGPRRWDAALAAAAVLLRLPLLAAPARPDEAGYLLVAQHAHPFGPYLYGDLWVDRPPLLVAFFAVADALGGLGALRLMALVPVVVLVLAAASSGRTLSGERGARSAALVAAALSATPLLGAPEVDGEVLAIPLVMLGCAVGLRALLAAPAARPRRSTALAVGAAGAAGTCALLVKQNFVDALVLLAVLLAVRAVRRDLPRGQARRLLAALVAGALVPLLLTLAWAAAWGSSPAGLWGPLFAFRSASLHVITSASTAAPARRALALVAVALVSGLALVLLTFVLTSLRRLRRGDPVTVAVAVMVLTATPSIALGGSYWIHYLLELVPAAALGAALLAGRARPVRRWTAGVLVVVVGSTLMATHTQAALARTSGCASAAGGATISAWLRDRADPGDTVVTLYGGASAVLGTGLRPAYPYLWSLPVRTLDPDLAGVTAALSGPHRATWVVQTLPLHSWGLDPQHHLEDVLAQGYQPAVRVCGRPVYLERGVSR